MELENVKNIVMELEKFQFEKAYPKIINLFEELYAQSNESEYDNINNLLNLTQEAMEYKDVIRLCDIIEYIIIPSIANN